MADVSYRRPEADGPYRRPEAPRRRSSMDAETKSLMMACAIRNEAMFKAVRDTLTVDNVREFIDVGIAALYQITLEFYAAYNSMPPKKLLSAELSSAVESESVILYEGELKRLIRFIKDAFEPTIEIATSDAYTMWGIKQVRLFLDEILAEETRQTLGDEDTVLSNIPDVLARLHNKAETIASLTHASADTPFPEGWEESRPMTITPTGFGFFDRHLDGGTTGGEIYLLLGPYGSCKTTLTVMGCAARAQQEYERTQREDWDGKNGLVFLVTYEASKAELRSRLLSYVAEIHRDSLKGAWKPSDLSTSSSLKDYEKKLKSWELSEKIPVNGERERMKKELPVLNRHLRILDMSGADPNRPGAGGGYVEEIARAVTTAMRQEKDTYPALVWIDYAGACAERYIQHRNSDHTETRHLLKGMGLLLRNQIAAPFDCAIFLNHQLSGEANNRTPGAPMHHTDAAEAKAMAENVDFAGCISTVTSDGLVTINWSKHRRFRYLPPSTLRIDGEFNKVTDVSAELVFDPGMRKIISVKDKRMLETTSAATPARGLAESTVSAKRSNPVDLGD